MGEEKKIKGGKKDTGCHDEQDVRERNGRKGGEEKDDERRESTKEKEKQ